MPKATPFTVEIHQTGEAGRHAAFSVKQDGLVVLNSRTLAQAKGFAYRLQDGRRVRKFLRTEG